MTSECEPAGPDSRDRRGAGEMSLQQAIEGRRSVRRFTSQDVPDEDIVAMVRAAGLAPSASNQQMWHFLIVRNRGLRERMRAAVLDRLESMLTWPEIAGHEQRIRGSTPTATFFADAPVTIAVLTRGYDNPYDSAILPARGFSFEGIHRLRGDPGRQSLGAAIQNLLLVAHAMGYGTCWMTGPLIAGDELEKVLNVESPWQLAALIPVGVPAENPSPRPRRPVEAIHTVLH